MQIKLKNLLSIDKTVDITLRPINFFIGQNGSGKSILSDVIQLFKANALQNETLKKHFPILSRFDHHSDWRSWVNQGDLSKEVIITRSCNFLYRKVILKVKITHCFRSNESANPQKASAEINSFIIQDGQNILMHWSKEERWINNRLLATFLYRAIHEHGHLSSQEWEDELDISPRFSDQLTTDLLLEYIQSHPENFSDETGAQPFFYLDLSALFFRHRLSIRNNAKFDSVTALMEKVLAQFQKEMNHFLMDTPILSGERKKMGMEKPSPQKERYASEYFGFSLLHKKIQSEDGTYLGQELFISAEGREDRLERFGMGYQKVCGWIDQWTDVIKILERETDSILFSSERLVIVHYPENYLSPQWQRQLLRMMADDVQRFPQLRLVFITHSQEFIRAASDMIGQGMVERNAVGVFQFRWEVAQQTTVQRLRMSEWTTGFHFGPMAQSSEFFPIGQFNIAPLQHWN
jgi:AAA15 family ATPase/GTPase